MIDFKIVRRKDILALLSDEAFWNGPFLAVSKNRLYAHYHNPQIQDEDVVLLLAYLDSNLAGYMGIYIDKILIQGTYRRIGWLSTWWVDPSTKGTGLGRSILDKMYDLMNGEIGISQFTQSAQRVYDKSGYFTALKKNRGIKAVLRSNLQFVIPAMFPSSIKLKALFNTLDIFFNFFINGKLRIQKKVLLNKLQSVTLEYLTFIDDQSYSIIKKYSQEDLTPKNKAFFEWLNSYNWVTKASVLDLTDIHRYAFSMYDIAFDYSFIKICTQGECVGFIVLQNRNYVTKVLFTYYDADKYVQEVTHVIKLHVVSLQIRELICYDEKVCEELKKSNLFLYTRQKEKNALISKVFEPLHHKDKRFNFGDGDCSFA